MSRIARVFPRRTQATPTDALAFTDEPGLFPPDVDEVHVSVTFTYDLPRAEELAKAWKHVAPVAIGGPATGMRGQEFTPGRYLKTGNVITSRGCPNRCWFCSVWRREGGVRTLPINDGFNVRDDNLLACPDDHIRAVFAMLKRQAEPIVFSGGLEAARIKPWHAQAMRDLRSPRLYFAYDTPDDYEPLADAASTLWSAGFRRGSHNILAYVLIGGPRDTFEDADKRIRQVVALGLMPFAMLYRDKGGKTDPQWRRFQRTWARPAIVASRKHDTWTTGGRCNADQGVLL